MHRYHSNPFNHPPPSHRNLSRHAAVIQGTRPGRAFVLSSVARKGIVGEIILLVRNGTIECFTDQCRRPEVHYHLQEGSDERVTMEVSFREQEVAVIRNRMLSFCLPTHNIYELNDPPPSVLYRNGITSFMSSIKNVYPSITLFVGGYVAPNCHSFTTILLWTISVYEIKTTDDDCAHDIRLY